MSIRAEFADKCAWRAVYVYRQADTTTGWNRWCDVQVFRLGFSPGDCGRASIFGAVGRWSWRIMLPRSRYWARFDGRNAYYASFRDLRNRVSV